PARLWRGLRAGRRPPGMSAMPDPFRKHCDEHSYFSDAAREKRLNLLLHLAPYSDLLLVTGEPGSGKSAFAGRFLAGAADTWRVLVVQGGPDTTDVVSLDYLAQERSVRRDEDADRGERLACLRRSLHALRRGALLPFLAIDDAHLLPPSAFS